MKHHLSCIFLLAFAFVTMLGAGASGAFAQVQGAQRFRSGDLVAYPADADAITQALALSLAENQGQAVSVGRVLQQLRLDLKHVATVEAGQDMCLFYFVVTTNNFSLLRDLYFQFSLKDSQGGYGEVVARLESLGGARPETHIQQFFVQVRCDVEQLNLVYARARANLNKSASNVPISLMSPQVLSLSSISALTVGLGPSTDSAAVDLGLASLTPIRPKTTELFPRRACAQRQLNMRSNPTAQSPRIGRLDGSDIVTILAETPDGNWARVLTAGGLSAFVITGHFGDCSAEVIAWAENPPVGLRDAESRFGVHLVPHLGIAPTLVCANRGGNFRVGPGQSYAVIGHISQTTPFVARAQTRGGAWVWAVDAEGREGFVYHTVLTTCPARFTMSVAQKTEPQADTETGAQGKEADSTPMFTFGVTPPDPVQVAFFQNRICTTGSINVRTAPSVSGRRITVFSKGVSAEILGYAGNWIHVEKDDVVGYIEGTYTQHCLDNKGLRRTDVPVPG